VYVFLILAEMASKFRVATARFSCSDPDFFKIKPPLLSRPLKLFFYIIQFRTMTYMLPLSDVWSARLFRSVWLIVRVSFVWTSRCFRCPQDKICKETMSVSECSRQTSSRMGSDGTPDKGLRTGVSKHAWDMRRHVDRQVSHLSIKLVACVLCHSNCFYLWMEVTARLTCVMTLRSIG
jgi:hypothetical protein